nr:bifunctional molybdenum cofactor biosynthesis protein MoaC/MoaB [Jonesia quinghaiensis]
MEVRKVKNVSQSLTHVNAEGDVRMVDVGGKPVSQRGAVARAFVVCSERVVHLLRTGELAKGDALAVARIAAIASVKKTPDLIPLCHPLAVTGVDVVVKVVEGGVDLEASVRTADRTGIEMEALTAVTVGALNIIDMVKAVDRGAHIGFARIDRKEGGASGGWVRDGAGTMTSVDETGEAEAVSPHVDNEEHPTPVSDPYIAVITVSDRAAAGERADETGPLLMAAAHRWTSPAVAVTVPDDEERIAEVVREHVLGGAWLVVTTGGTGITTRDVTPQAVEPLFDRSLPALAHQLQISGVGKAPGALLSRSVAGISRRTLVVTLPGSVGAVRDGIAVLDGIVEHVREQLRNANHDDASQGVVVQGSDS